MAINRNSLARVAMIGNPIRKAVRRNAGDTARLAESIRKLNTAPARDAARVMAEFVHLGEGGSRKPLDLSDAKPQEPPLSKGAEIVYDGTDPSRLRDNVGRVTMPPAAIPCNPPAIGRQCCTPKPCNCGGCNG